MEIKRARALMAYAHEVKKGTISERLRSRLSVFQPSDIHEGELVLLMDKLIFNEHKRGASTKVIDIDKSEIKDVFLGYDDVFERIDGITFEPLRIRFRKEGIDTAIYLNVDFNRAKRTNKNPEWYNELQKWTGANTGN